jgi:mannose-6-phosphate isomerase
VWGRRSLEPFFSELPSDALYGEVWFTSGENPTSVGVPLLELLENEPGALGTAADPANSNIVPLLVKLLFTSERLSVQVHPNDLYAREHHNSLGKTEAWYVVDAHPPGELAVGFREPIDLDVLKRAAQTGEIEELLDWRKVSPGDAIYVPAGTVHAIGAGLTICEIQENSDITYRIYDYGRPRELHLEHGAAVSKLGPPEHTQARVKLAAWREQLIVSEYFRIERLRPVKSFEIDRGLPLYLLLICLRGNGMIGRHRFQAGECWFVPAGNAHTEITGGESEWILTYKSAETLRTIRGE